MAVQRRNADLVSLLTPDFVRRGELLQGFRSVAAYDVDGTAVTVLESGATGVQYAVTGFYVVRPHDETTPSYPTPVTGTLATLEPGDTVDLYNVGLNVLTLSVNVDGSISVQRTAVAAFMVYDVRLLLVWL